MMTQDAIPASTAPANLSPTAEAIISETSPLLPSEDRQVDIISTPPSNVIASDHHETVDVNTKGLPLPVTTTSGTSSSLGWSLFTLLQWLPTPPQLFMTIINMLPNSFLSAYLKCLTPTPKKGDSVDPERDGLLLQIYQPQAENDPAELELWSAFRDFRIRAPRTSGSAAKKSPYSTHVAGPYKARGSSSRNQKPSMPSNRNTPKPNKKKKSKGCIIM